MRHYGSWRPATLSRSIGVLIGLAAAPGLANPASAETTPPQPATAQPTLPKEMPGLTAVGGSPKTLDVHRRADRRHRGPHHHYGRIDREPLDRPALGSVELLAPLPPPVEPPHVTVPVPAYPLEAFTAAYTTPPPPVVCHRVRRDPNAPDPRLRGEIPVLCEPDTP